MSWCKYDFIITINPRPSTTTKDLPQLLLSTQEYPKTRSIRTPTWSIRTPKSVVSGPIPGVSPRSIPNPEYPGYRCWPWVWSLRWASFCCLELMNEGWLSEEDGGWDGSGRRQGKIKATGESENTSLTCVRIFFAPVRKICSRCGCIVCWLQRTIWYRMQYPQKKKV